MSGKILIIHGGMQFETAAESNNNAKHSVEGQFVAKRKKTHLMIWYSYICIRREKKHMISIINTYIYLSICP